MRQKLRSKSFLDAFLENAKSVAVREQKIFIVLTDNVMSGYATSVLNDY